MPRNTERLVDDRWLLVSVCFLALAISFSLRAVLGLVMPDMEREFGTSRSTVSAIGATALLAMTVMAPFAGASIDRVGPRLLLTFGLLAVGVGSQWIALATGTAHLVFAYGGVSAIGFSFVATNVVAAAIGKRFEASRGLAIGIGTAGATAGQLAIVPLVALATASGSWRDGFQALAIAAVVLGIVAFLILRSGSSRPGAVESVAPRGDIKTLVWNPAFQLLFWSFLLCGFTTTGVVETHFLPYAAFCGFPPLPSAAAYGVLCFINLIGMICAGWLSDRWHRPALLGIIYVARAVTFLLLIKVYEQAPDVTMLFAFAVLFGIFDYSTVPVTVSLAASHLGTERLGLAMGLISAGHAAGGAAGALAGGALFDGLGRYTELWTASLVLSALAGLLIILLPDRSSPAMAQAEGAA